MGGQLERPRGLVLFRIWKQWESQVVDAAGILFVKLFWAALKHSAVFLTRNAGAPFPPAKRPPIKFIPGR